MKTWDKFYPDVLPKVMGCPEPVADFALLRAAQEFFDAVRVWRSWLPDITTQGNTVSDYILLIDPGTVLVRIERATLNGRPIRVRSEDQLPADWKTYQNAMEDGVHTPDGIALILLPPKDAGMALKIEASMRPDDTAKGMRDDLFARYAKAIADGAIARIKEVSNEPYTDPAGAVQYRARFLEAVNEGDFRRWRGLTSARPRPRIATY